MADNKWRTLAELLLQAELQIWSFVSFLSLMMSICLQPWQINRLHLHYQFHFRGRRESCGELVGFFCSHTDRRCVVQPFGVTKSSRKFQNLATLYPDCRSVCLAELLPLSCPSLSEQSWTGLQVASWVPLSLLPFLSILCLQSLWRGRHPLGEKIYIMGNWQTVSSPDIPESLKATGQAWSQGIILFPH